MKTLLVILGLIISTANLHAQKVIPVVDLMLKDSIGENATRNGKQFGLLELIRRQTKNTRDEVADTRTLQYDYQAFLRQTTSTASLAISDATTEQEATGEVLGTAQHLGDYSFAADLYAVYQAAVEPMDKSEALYEILIPYDETMVFGALSSLEAYQKARQQNVMALEEMNRRRKLQQAKAYQQRAQRKIEKAAELRARLTTDQRFSMTESERLETLSQMQKTLQESQHLKVKVDQLMQQVTQPSLAKTRVLHAYEKQQERYAIGTTLLYQD
ncbi:hypothetical protein [Tunicatimonas pelagia]|uniref:hypothetical protein n=1 Tax=Tunicatimonas pelagia TaxID=931531 RepID=UPI002666133C|nr:hypothetical protein [Tunicatimonas pelagia]WKN44926.1 hypothetical protein P0M28_08115 [Tunicatimonas pelagia]